MRYTVRALIVLALVSGAVPAHAQNPGIPVYNMGVPRGIALYGDVAFPNDQAGGGTVYGVTGRAGFGMIGATATLSTFNPDGPGDSHVSVGGTLNYRLLGGPLVPLSVTLQGGASYLKVDDAGLIDDEISLYHVPIGIGFALVIPNPVLSIHPCLAPRLDITHQTGMLEPDTRTNFGLSGGLELNLLNGFGVHAAYDRVFAGDVADPATFGIGAHYAFRVPGL
ncbi:MAG TPA: hypothetical protein VMY76_13710 [Gemmatimonadales bacterium]|nr:hypothetical protein [Gemmatimonadales bacterium]